MLSMKCFQVVALALAAVGFGLAPAADVYAGSCSTNSRPSHDRWHSSQQHRPSHDRWHSSSHNTRHYSQRNTSHRGYDSRASVSYRNDNVQFSVSVGSGHTYRQDRPSYHRDSYPTSRTVVYTNSQPSGYWSRVYHQPVYETRYQICGTPYRVCVRAGYYERVWISTSTTYCR